MVLGSQFVLNVGLQKILCAVWNYNLRGTSNQPAYYKFVRVCQRGCSTTAPAAHSLHSTLMGQRQLAL